MQIDVTKIANQTTVDVGETMRYTVRVTNNSSVRLDSIDIEDVYNSDCVVFTDASVTPPTTNTPPTIGWEGWTALNPSQQYTFWMDFLAQASCSFATNEDTVTVTGHYQTRTVVATATEQVRIR